MNKETILKKYNITIEDFKNSKCDWNELEKIYAHFDKTRHEYIPVAEDIAKRLMNLEMVHSVKYRVKDSEHLVVKIIRKKIDNPADVFTVENYSDKLTDIVGVRAMHLYKSNWKDIGEYVVTTWGLNEKQKAYIRKGDDEKLSNEYKEKGYEVLEHKYGYRSLHYILKSKPTNKEYKSELQVRTIFEEAWSEIDHDVRYPFDMNNIILKDYLATFNRLAGSADEMGSFIKFLKKELDEMKQKHGKEIEEKNKLINKLKSEIDKLQISKKEKDAITVNIDQLIEKSNFNVGDGLLEGLKSKSPFFFNTKKESGLLGSLADYQVCPKCNRPFLSKWWRNVDGLCDNCSTGL